MNKIYRFYLRNKKIIMSQYSIDYISKNNIICNLVNKRMGLGILNDSFEIKYNLYYQDLKL